MIEYSRDGDLGRKLLELTGLLVAELAYPINNWLHFRR